MLGQRQRHAALGDEGPPVLEIARQRALAGIEVDAADAVGFAQQRHDDMHRCGRLARAAPPVAEHDAVRLAPRPRRRVRQQGDHAGRAHTAVSWKTAPPLGGPGSALVSALMPSPPSKAALGQMLSTTSTSRASPSNSRAWTMIEAWRLPSLTRPPSAMPSPTPASG